MTDGLARLTAALADRYAIERELGAGGMATVYLAHDIRHDRKVALKVLRPELSAILGAERFLHEIKTTANLQHPHILGLFDSGEADGLVFYVMPYVEGESLRDRINREKQLPVDDAVRIASEVADALDYAHRHGVIHRDIKPENILLHDGRVQVADFGIALAVSTAGGGTRMTETGMSLGTPHYIAPGQAMWEREITPKADIYALGCVLYEMLTGEPPFTGATAQAIIARVMTEHPRSLTLQRRTIPPHVEAAVNAALEKLPADRIGSAAQWAEALRTPGLLRATSSQAPAAAPLRRSPLRVAALVVPWLVAAGFGGALAWQRFKPRPLVPAVRLGIALPDSIGLRTDGASNSLALAPDGSALVYVGNGPGRARMLYVRDFAQLEPRILPGTEGADAPTFSPDGAWIAFFGGGQLKRVALAGGPPLTIAASPSSRGATWGPDGTIIYAAAASGLLRVAAAGGRVDTITALRQDSGETSHRLPHFMPDGKSVVFTVQQNGRFRIAVMTLGRPGFRRLFDEASDARYVSTGHLVYGTEGGALVAATFDSAELTVTGSPVSLTEGMLIKGAIGTADFTVSQRGQLAYVSGENRPSKLLVTDAAGGNERPVLEGQNLGSPRFSPDGRRVAFSSIEGHQQDVRVVDLDHGTVTRLTFNANAVYPEWTHDGHRVAFTSTKPGAATGLDLFWTLADGSAQPESLLVAPGAQQELQFAPGDRTFALRTIGALGRDIMVSTVDSPTVVRTWLATPFEERSMALSPDGHWLAYVSNASGHDEVYVREFPVPQGQWQISAGGGLEPRWTHRGDAILYRVADSLVSVAITTRPAFKVGERHTLFTRPFFTGDTHHAHWDVAPDDRHFVFISAPTVTPGVIVTLNWFDELRRRTAAPGAPASP